MISRRGIARGAGELRQSLASLVGTVELIQAAALAGLREALASVEKDHLGESQGGLLCATG